VQPHRKGVHVIELIRSNDPVLISFVATLLTDAGIVHSVTDTNMSVIDGSIGAIQNRIMVAEDRQAEARRLLADAGVDIETS
jgi:hypothetical protein